MPSPQKQDPGSSRSLWDEKLNSVSLNTGQQLHTLQQGPERQSLLLISVGYKKQGQPLTITIAEDLNPINKNIDQFQYWFAVIAFGHVISPGYLAGPYPPQQFETTHQNT